MSREIIKLNEMKKIIRNKEIVKPVEIKYTARSKEFDRITTSQEKSKKILSY